MGRSPHPSPASLVKHEPSRHRGLEVSVFALKRGPQFRAYVHTPGWERVLAVSTGESADAAMDRAEAVLAQAIGAGVDVNLPAARRPLRLRSADEASG
jgi:hypothetical protein